MALRYRKRTKGKNGWLNFSWSDKHGLNASVSVKAGPFTWNSGNGKTTKRRITTNLPGGFYHVSTDKTPRKRQPVHYTESGDSYSVGSSTKTRWWLLLALTPLAYILFEWWGVGWVIGFALMMLLIGE